MSVTRRTRIRESGLLGPSVIRSSLPSQAFTFPSLWLSPVYIYSLTAYRRYSLNEPGGALGGRGDAAHVGTG